MRRERMTWVPPALPWPRPVDRLPSPDVPPGSLCEQCLAAPATQLLPAPWGGDMGVCEGCAKGETAVGHDEEAEAPSQYPPIVIEQRDILAGMMRHIPTMPIPPWRVLPEALAVSSRRRYCDTHLDARVATPHGQPCTCGEVRFIYQPRNPS